MNAHRDHHATIFVAPEIASPIEALRRAWDPAMATQVAAHVTLVYPREAPIVELLVDRVRIASAWAAPFRLRLGKITHAGRPEDGVYVEVEDIDGGHRALRENILRPPFTARPLTPHVTLVHLRTSTQGRACWDATGLRALDLEFTATEISITAFDGTKWDALETFSLRRGG